MIQKTRNWAFAAMMIWGIGSSMAQQRNTLFNDDWEFIKEGQEAVTVDLPHDWSILGVPSADEPSGNDGGYYPTGKAQYRKVLHLGQLSPDRRYALYFEGVYMNAEVVVNGVSTGVQHYGYSSFLRDVTKLLHEGDNEIVVNVDNSQQRNTRWYSGSGIYRHVWLIETADVHFKHWGTFITTPIVDAEGTSQVSVKTTLVNESDRERIMQVKVCLQGATDDGGDLSATKETIIRLQPNEESQAELLIDVPNAHLWSPDTPYLYEANLSVSEQGNPNKTIDQVTETFGIRSIAFSAEQGFLLNGQPIELNGGCLHHDNGILGASAFDRAEERKAELMKAAGFNAVRTSHNHPSSTFLDACDRIGLLVIDEAFDGWRSAKTPHDYSKYIDEYWREDLAALVLRDRNHPSIFAWSMGNEVIERKEIQVVTTARKLARYCRELDPTRPVTSALCAWDSDWEIYDPLAEAFELVGYNYMIFKHRTDHERDPQRVMYQSESYPRDAFRNWAYSADYPYIFGDFVWTAVDYQGESAIGRWYYEGDSPGEHYHRSQFPWHAAYCGDIDFVGQRKAISYYRDILWNVDRPLYLSVKEPNGYYGKIRETQWSVWPTFESWTWPGHEGKPIDVEIYSRSPRIRLYLNDSLVAERATTRAEEYKAVITIPYTPGTLRAEAIDEQGNPIPSMNTGRNILRTAGTPYAIRLKADRTAIQANNQDLSFITVEVVDKNGVVCPNAANELSATLAGRGTLAAFGNADIKDLGCTVDNVHNVWKGRSLAVVRSTYRSGNAVLTVTGKGLKSAKVVIKTK
jgi:beta-galactosidase